MKPCLKTEDSQEVEYEMLIEDVLEGFAERSESDSGSTNVTATTVENLDQQLKREPEELEGQRRESADDDDVKVVLECLYHSSDSGKEFIKVETAKLATVDQLNSSAQLVHADLEICLQNFSCMMFVGSRFLAKLEPINVDVLRQATSFAQAKSILLGNLRVVQIVVDEATAERKSQRAALLNLFDKIRLGLATCRSSAVDAAQILRIAESSNTLDYCKLCETLRENSEVSGELKEQAVRLLRIEREIQHRNEFLKSFYSEFHDDAEELKIALQQVCEAVVSNQANAVLDKMPQYLRDLLKDTPRLTICRVHENDVKAFNEMESVWDVEVFRKPLADLAARWIDNVNSAEASVALLDPNYAALCRSLVELITDIADSSEHRPEELLRSDKGGWYPLETAIRWKLEKKVVWYLEREYRFVFQVLNHFFPAAGTVGPFEYQADRSFEGTIAEELRVWFCLLDDVLRNLKLGPFEQIVTSFVQLLQKSDGHQMEEIRIVTHGIARFIIQTCPRTKWAESDEDKQILHSQLDVVKRALFGCANTFRDLLDVITTYWKNRCEIVENYPHKSSALTIVTFALRPNDDVHHVITLLRNVNLISQSYRTIKPNMDQNQAAHTGESTLPATSSPSRGSPEAPASNIQGNNDDGIEEKLVPTSSVIASSKKLRQRMSPAFAPVTNRVVNKRIKVSTTSPLPVPVNSPASTDSNSCSESQLQATTEPSTATATVRRSKRSAATRRIDSPNFGFVCDLCNKRLSRKLQLDMHKKVMHTD